MKNFTDEEAKAILAAPMISSRNTSYETTIGGYLGGLLARLLFYGEGFSGKRPFGDSGWEEDLFIALVSAGFVKGKYVPDEDDDPEKSELYGEWDYDEAKAEQYLQTLIRSIFGNGKVI